MTSSMMSLVRSFLSRFGLPLVVMSLLWLTWQFHGLLQAQGWEAFWQRQGTDQKSYVVGLELVIAMPISWLPLIADYARFGTRSRSAFAGSWLGYALANVWCYALGVMVTRELERSVVYRERVPRLLKQLGPDTGFDSIGDFPQAQTLAAYLDKLDSENSLPKTILYNLNPADNYLMATMIGTLAARECLMASRV